MVTPWIFEFFPTYGLSEPEAYAWHMDLWGRLEGMGFEGIFFSEHHFGKGRLTPSPNLLIAALAARTTRLRLGAMGMVLPLYEPWRAAEEVAMLDQISQGRLEMGVSSGAGPMEMRQVGMDLDEVRPRFAEGLEVLEAALSQDSFSHQGRFYSYRDLSITPRPVQQPLPSRWMTLVSAATAAMAGSKGYRACTGFLDNEAAKVLFEAHAAAARAAGQPSGPDRCALRRQILVADTDEAAQAASRAATAKLVAMFGGGQAREDHASGAPDAPPTPRGLFFGEDETIAGSPGAVAEAILEQCRSTGSAHMLAYPHITAELAAVERSYALWPQVITRLRAA